MGVRLRDGSSQKGFNHVNLGWLKQYTPSRLLPDITIAKIQITSVQSQAIYHLALKNPAVSRFSALDFKSRLLDM